MLRVVSCIVNEHDYRLVLLAVLICAATSFTALHAYSHATREQGARRLAWVFLTAVATGTGIWATHFVAMLAYDPGFPTAYDAVLTIGSLLIAVIVATAGFALSARGSRAAVASGGAIIGSGIALMHFTGMKALALPGVIHWDLNLVVASVLIGIALSAASLLAWHELERRWALWGAPALLTAAICGMHFTAMGAVTFTPEPTMAFRGSNIDNPTLAIAVTAASVVVMLAVLVVMLIANQAERLQLLRNQELVDAALEGLIVAKDGRIINVNQRLLKLTRRSSAELLGTAVVGDLLTGEIETSAPSSLAAQALLKTATGITIPVEVVHRPLVNGARGDAVYAIRDLTERRRAEQELRRQNEVLHQRKEELRTQNRRFEATISNMPHGLCMIDPDKRLVVCNKRYVDMYDLPAHLVRPGTPIEEIFEHRVARGLYAAEEDEEYKREDFDAMLVPSTKTRRLSDGRVVQIVRQPTGDGGWIAIHEDITERERLSARLAEQNVLLRRHEAELEAQNASLDMALTNMSQGLAMFDAEERLVVANDRYAEIYGLAPEHLQPGTTLRQLVEHRIAGGLYPGLTADDVVNNMRHRVALGDANHLISRPGDGRILSVSVHPRQEGGWVVTLQDITEREELNARLKIQNALLQQREAELAEQNTRFDAAISNMSQGMCLYDAQQRIVFANNRYAEIYGLVPEQVKPGTTLREIFAARAARGAYGQVDAEKFIRDGLARFRKCTSQILKLEDGRFISVVRRPMPDGGLLSTHEDITEREQLGARLAEQNELLTQREQELNARNEQLDAALENMVQGLAMYDAEQHLIVCNRRYAEMYGLTPEQVKPGTTVRQIFEYRLANGHYEIKDTEGFVKSWAQNFGETSSRIQKLADGRSINVLRRRTAGGGRIITHEDVTERQQLNARLAEQNELLKQQEEKLRAQNVQLDAALENMLQGLAMYDAEHRLVVCNRRYAEIYGLSPEHVKPGAHLKEIIEHRIANGEFPGRTAEELIGGMRERMAGSKVVHYTSELTDGRYIAVSVQPMPHGGTVTTHHDITEQRRSEARIAHMALHDTLTGSAQPRAAERAPGGCHAARQARRDRRHASVSISTTSRRSTTRLGHPAGDKLLRTVADRLRALIRETDTIARMGGDEFAIVQSAIAQPADATSLAHRAIEAVSAPYLIEGHQVVIGTSIGIAVGPSDGLTPEQLVRNADLALYRAKGDGRGTYRFFEREMDAQMQSRRTPRGRPAQGPPDRRVRAALSADRQSGEQQRSAASRR